LSSSICTDVVDDVNLSEFTHFGVGGVEAVGREGDISNSSNVENPLGFLSLASMEFVVGDTGEEALVNVEDVLTGKGRIASHGKDGSEFVDLGIGGQSGQLVADVDVVLLDEGKILEDGIVGETTWKGSGSHSGGEVNSIASNVGSFRSIRRKRSARAVDPIGITTNNQRERGRINNFVTARSGGFISNRVSGSSVEVVEAGKSSFSVSSVDIGVSKEDGIVLSNIGREKARRPAEFRGSLEGAVDIGGTVGGDVDSAQVNDLNRRGSGRLGNQLQGS